MQSVSEALIRSIRLRAPGGIMRFAPSPTGSPHDGRIAIELYIDHAALRRVAVLAMRLEPLRLGGLPLTAITRLLIDSLQGDFWRFMNRLLPELGGRRIETLSALADQADIMAIAARIERTLSAMAPSKLWFVPAWRLRAEGRLDRGEWIIARGGEPHPDCLDAVIPSRGLNGALFPPMQLQIRHHPVGDRDAWLVVRAREQNQAFSRFAMLFGAISLAADFPQSRNFSAAEYPDGLFSIDGNDRPTYRTRGPEFPPLLDGASLSADQLEWIGRLLHDPTRSPELQLRILTCLEYVAAGWQPPGRLGFVHNAIAFDALFGINGQVTKSIVAGVTTHAPNVPQIEARIRSLLKIRNALLHGSAASVELTSEYLDYCDHYDVDPHRDQISILRTCLFGLNQ